MAGDNNKPEISSFYLFSVLFLVPFQFIFITYFQGKNIKISYVQMINKLILNFEYIISIKA